MSPPRRRTLHTNTVGAGVQKDIGHAYAVIARPLVLLALALLGGCSAGPSPAETRASIPVVAPPVTEFLRVNGASFDLADPPATGDISVAQAMEAARTQLSVPLGSTSNTSFGRLRDSRLGTRSDRSAWLVVFAVPSGTAWAFVDAVDGQMLETFAPGP